LWEIWSTSDGKALFEDTRTGQIFSRTKSGETATPDMTTDKYDYTAVYEKTTNGSNEWKAVSDTDSPPKIYVKDDNGDFKVKNSWNYNKATEGYSLDSNNKLHTADGKTLTYYEDMLDGTNTGGWLDSDSKEFYRLASDGSLGKLGYTEEDGQRISKLKELIPQTAGPIKQATQLVTKEQGISTGYGLAGSTGSALSTKMKDLQFAQNLQFDKNGNFAFSVNNKSFTFSQNDTLANVINTVNADLTANVKMSYSSATDGFTIESKKSGTDSTLKISNISGNFFGINGATGLDINASGVESGKNAVFTLNGKEVTRDSNNFTMDGIRYTLNSVTEGEADETVKFSLNRNVQPAVDKIKAFVDGYNELVSKLTTLTSETKSKDERTYVPLTDDQKAAMTEEQVKQWEDIAKKGIMHNDTGVQNLLSTLRGALFEKVSEVGLSPSEIGLSTYSYDYSKGGQIELNETKLREALENRPNDVAKIFTDSSVSENKSTKYQESGLLNRIMDSFSSYNVGPNTALKSSIQTQLSSMSLKYAEMQNKFADMEEKYYKKFAALESAISKIQAQGDSFASMTGMS
jgi:flagellar hook-associated protein 2